jgi:hypothetical protein
MKRKIFAALAISAIAFVSCKKEEAATPTAPETATFKGTLWANTDASNDTIMGGFPGPTIYTASEVAPSGTVVTVIVDSELLDPTPEAGYNYQDLKYTTTVGAGGTFTISNIPCYNTPIDVEVMFNDFTAAQKKSGTLTENENFFLGSDVITIYAGAVVIKDYAYNY